MDYTSFNRRMIVAVHLLLGFQYLLGGLNWWFKIFPFPNFFDVPTGPGKHAVLDAMISTGWMFTSAKIIELLTGLALIFRRYVPLMLVVSFPVALATFLIDAMIFNDMIAWFRGEVSGAFFWSKIMDLIFFGGAVITMQVYLMIAYFHHYSPMLASKAEARVP